MIVAIDTLSTDEVSGLISNEIAPKLTEDGLKIFNRMLAVTTIVWAGSYQGKLKALWGLAPPTMLSDSAYLWLHVVDSVDDCEFLFVRNSQRAIEEALKRFPTIIGHCERSNKKAQRWLRWLGATFEQPQGEAIQFVIKAREPVYGPAKTG